MVSPFVVFDTILNSMTTKFQINERKNGQDYDHADNTHRHCKEKIKFSNSVFLYKIFLIGDDFSFLILGSSID